MNASNGRSGTFSTLTEQYIAVLDSTVDITPAELLEIAQDLSQLDMTEEVPGLDAADADFSDLGRDYTGAA